MTLHSRDIGRDHLPGIARLHVAAFPDSALSKLGVEAVERNYLWQLFGPHDVVGLAGFDDADLVGFLVGGVFRGSTIGFVKQEKWFLIHQVARNPGILRDGLGRRRIALALRLLARRAHPARSEDPTSVPTRSFGVLAIAVDPRAQGRGAGRMLMEEACIRAIAAGFTRMHLSVHPNNARGLRFYSDLGWHQMQEPDGSWVGRLKLDLLAEPRGEVPDTGSR